MARIIELVRNNEYSTTWVVSAPEIARAARPGEFTALRIAKDEDPVPLTIVFTDPEQGTLTIVIATGGKHVEHRLLDFQQGDDLELSGPVAIEDVAAWGRHADVPARAPVPFADSCGCGGSHPGGEC